jgi:hypothetical protein
MLIPELAGEGSLGALFTKDPILLRRQSGAPFGIGLRDGRRLRVSHRTRIAFVRSRL